MKILFDNKIFMLQKYGGISRYFCNLIYQLQKDPLISIKLPLFYSENYYLNQIKKLYCSTSFKNQTVKKFFNIVNEKLNIYFLKKNFDLFHHTYFEPYFLPYLNDRPFILTIHDMISEIYNIPDQNKKILAQKASKIIAISNNTKQDILKFYTDIPANKIEVIYLANFLSFSSCKAQKIKLIPENNFFLYVGTRGKVKNFINFIKAATPILEKNRNLKIICAGGGPFTQNEIELFQTLGITNQLQQITTNDQELKYLYQNATAFIFPSLYEGFGLPTLEAFACGCPTILHFGSSLPEIAEDAALYCDGNNINSISEQIEKITNDKQQRNFLIKKGYARAKEFSLEKMTFQTKKVYQNTIKDYF